MKSRAYINATPVPFAEDYNVSSAMVSFSCRMTEKDIPLIYEGRTPQVSLDETETESVSGELGPDDFNKIIYRFNESLHSFIYHILHDMDATEDVVQDTFLSLWINRGRIDLNIPLRNYLYVTARNFAYRHLRSRKRFDNDLPPVPSEEQVSAYMVQEEAIRILKESIGRLPPRTAEVLRLSLEGMPQERIAEQMGVGVANVKRLKALGITKLKEIMGPLFSLVSCLLQ